MKTLQQLNFDNSYARLPNIFYSEHETEPLANSHLVHFNPHVAELIELDPAQVKRPDFIDIMTGRQPLPGFQPVAMCYAGHQFGHYVPRLGDGRALLLGEVQTDKGEKWDLHLKGGGPTLYSRGGDGRAVLRSTIREYLCSEAMHGLGIPTTRALCMTGSHEEVYREQIETGAMNTDNMSIHGITLDYGPYGFLDQYQPDFICNHSDHHGRYAFNRQPAIGLFNLSCLAQALLPLIDPQPEAAAEKAKAELENYQAVFIEHYATLMRAKLGWYENQADDKTLCDELLAIMHASQVDYTLLFRSISGQDIKKLALNARNLFIDGSTCDAWMKKYRSRLNAESCRAEQRSRNMKSINPTYILRNHLAETAIRRASDDADFSEIDRLLSVLQSPFDEHSDCASYAAPPPTWLQDIKVSCSS